MEKYPQKIDKLNIMLASFWTAQAISLFGDRLNNFSLVALISRFANDPSITLSELYLAMFLPLFILAPVIGVVVDHLEKKWILIVTDFLRALLVALIPFVYNQGGSFLGIFILVFLLSTGNLFFLPAKSAIVPELVSRDKLVKVNSFLWIAGIVGVIAGFLGGGVIFDKLSWKYCFYIDALTYFISSMLLITLLMHKSAKRISTPDLKGMGKNTLALIAEGIKELKGSIELKKPMFTQVLIFFGAGGFSVLAVPIIKSASFNESSMGLSYAGIAVGAGMGVGSYIANRIKNFRSIWLFETLFFLLLAPAVSIMPAMNNMTSVILSCSITGLCASPLIILSETELQKRSSEFLRGRIFSLRDILTKSFFLISAFLISFLDNFLSRNLLLIILGLFLACIGTIWIVVSSLRVKKEQG